MKTHKIAIKWKRISASMMIVLTLMSLGIAAYADADDPATVGESEVVGIGAEPTVVVCTAEVNESEVVSIGAEWTMSEAEPTVVVCTAEVNESEIVGIDAEPTVVVCTAEVNESEVVGIGAEQTRSETGAIGAESRSGSTTAREKDDVPDTGEVSYTMVLLPIFLFGVTGMVAFGRKRCLYESA